MAIAFSAVVMIIGLLIAQSAAGTDTAIVGWVICVVGLLGMFVNGYIKQGQD